MFSVNFRFVDEFIITPKYNKVKVKGNAKPLLE